MPLPNKYDRPLTFENFSKLSLSFARSLTRSLALARVLSLSLALSLALALALFQGGSSSWRSARAARMPSRHRFSKASHMYSLVPVHSKYNKALTFENFPPPLKTPRSCVGGGGGKGSERKTQMRWSCSMTMKLLLRPIWSRSKSLYKDAFSIECVLYRTCSLPVNLVASSLESV